LLLALPLELPEEFAVALGVIAVLFPLEDLEVDSLVDPLDLLGEHLFVLIWCHTNSGCLSLVWPEISISERTFTMQENLSTTLQYETIISRVQGQCALLLRQ
jgi:hypothetical protein